MPKTKNYFGRRNDPAPRDDSDAAVITIPDEDGDGDASAAVVVLASKASRADEFPADDELDELMRTQGQRLEDGEETIPCGETSGHLYVEDTDETVAVSPPAMQHEEERPLALSAQQKSEQLAALRAAHGRMVRVERGMAALLPEGTHDGVRARKRLARCLVIIDAYELRILRGRHDEVDLNDLRAEMEVANELIMDPIQDEFDAIKNIINIHN